MRPIAAASVCVCVFAAFVGARAQTPSFMDLPAECPSYAEVGLDGLVRQGGVFASGESEERRAAQFAVVASAAYVAAGQNDCALAFADRLVALAPESGSPYLTRVVAQLGRNNPNAALSDVERAIVIFRGGGGVLDRNPVAGGFGNSLADAYRLRINVYMALRDFPRALSELNRLLADASGASRAPLLSRRARLYIRMHRYNEAIADCDAARTDRGDIGECSAVRADAHFGNREYDEAIILYDERVRALDSGWRIPARDRARAPGAFRVIELNTARARASACRAKIRGGFVEAAAPDCAGALEAAPNDAYVLYAAHELAAAQGAQSRAAELLAEARRADPRVLEACGRDAPCP